MLSHASSIPDHEKRHKILSSFLHPIPSTSSNPCRRDQFGPQVLSTMTNVKSRKIAVMGSRSVEFDSLSRRQTDRPGIGKSSLTVQYVENHFVESYYPTIENTFSKHTKIKNQEYTIEIIDTAGQDEYSILNSRHSIGIHGYLLVYSVTSRQSLEMVTIIRDKILNHTGTEWVPICLVGNKSDLHQQRQVSAEDGRRLSEEWNCAWTEASARNNENVSKAFELVIGQVEKQFAPPAEERGKCIIS